MNPGQEKFFDFMLERALPEKVEHVRSHLLGSFQSQQAKPLSRQEFDTLKAHMLGLMKPEHVEEVSKAMDHFGQNLK